MEGKRNEATHANIHMHVHTQTHYMLLYNKLAQCKRKGKIKEASNMRAHTHIDTETKIYIFGCLFEYDIKIFTDIIHFVHISLFSYSLINE